MTQQELLAAALAAMKNAQWDPLKWCEAIRDGYKGSPYNFKQTWNYNAQQLLWQAAHASTSPPPPPPPPPSSNPFAALARKVMFTAWRPGDGLRAPPPWIIAVTADVNVANNPAGHIASCKNVVAAAHARGQKVATWANQVQVSPEAIRLFHGQVGTDYIIWQGETAYEYETAIANGAGVIVGNPNSWTDAQRADATSRINAGKLAVIFETYTNEGDPWPNLSSAQGVPVTSMCPGVGWGKYPIQLPEYRQHMTDAQWAAMCLYLAEDLSEESWSVLPS